MLDSLGSSWDARNHIHGALGSCSSSCCILTKSTYYHSKIQIRKHEYFKTHGQSHVTMHVSPEKSQWIQYYPVHYENSQNKNNLYHKSDSLETFPLSAAMIGNMFSHVLSQFTRYVFLISVTHMTYV